MKATRLLSFLAVVLITCLTVTSCNKNKGKTKDPLSSTTWTAYDGDFLMVLKFELGTRATFYVGDNNLDRIGPVSTSAYTLTDNTKLSFADLNGSMDVTRYRFKTGTLDGDAMTIVYDRWTSASGIDGQKTHLQAVFKKK